VEALEDRILPADDLWRPVIIGNNWSDGRNWSERHPPAQVDTPVFDQASAASCNADAAITNTTMVAIDMVGFRFTLNLQKDLTFTGGENADASSLEGRIDGGGIPRGGIGGTLTFRGSPVELDGVSIRTRVDIVNAPGNTMTIDGGNDSFTNSESVPKGGICV
jgi:hypothetical protein